MFNLIMRILTISSVMAYLWTDKQIKAKERQEPTLRRLPPQYHVVYQPGNDRVSIYVKNSPSAGTFWALPDMSIDYDEHGDITKIEVWYASKKERMLPPGTKRNVS